MMYFISAISSFLSGLGIGGGAIFILITSIVGSLDLNQARAYNLVLFVAVGIVCFIKNFKQEDVGNKAYFKQLFIILIGCGIGVILNKFIDENSIKFYFYILMILIGLYEIISSLVSKNSTNNNNVKGGK